MPRSSPSPRSSTSDSPATVVVHGGAAGTAELIDVAVAACRTAAQAGLDAVADGGTALDAVEAAVIVLEDAPELNAGTGAALTDEGGVELDAAIMDGSSFDAGAVAALPAFRHPISVARAALADGRHVFYAGEGAARFAIDSGFEPVAPEELITEHARRRLDIGNTVGAVALDADGRLAAATSTGGIPGQARGRVGDTPIIGAGTYAAGGGAACSATGDGEAILRATLARDAVALVEGGESAADAAKAAVARLTRVGRGTGGLILVDHLGGVGVAYNTALMSHAVARAGGPVETGS